MFSVTGDLLQSMCRFNKDTTIPESIKKSHNLPTFY